IGRSVEAGETLINRVGGRQVIDQHHGAGAFAAVVKADRGAFPEHAAVAGVLGVELAVAVAQADHEGAAAFLTEYIAVGLTPAADGLLHHLRQSARYRAEEAMPFANDLIGLEGVPALRRLVLGGGKVGAKGDEAQSEGRKAQGSAHRMLHWVERFQPRLTGYSRSEE